MKKNSITNAYITTQQLHVVYEFSKNCQQLKLLYFQDKADAEIYVINNGNCSLSREPVMKDIVCVEDDLYVLGEAVIAHHQYEQHSLRQRALAKLTQEEKRALGIC